MKEQPKRMTIFLKTPVKNKRDERKIVNPKIQEIIAV
jgi:hypothetical protein